jgi:uncharacterized protein
MPIRFRRLPHILLILALSAPAAARADEASHRAKAKELMTLLKTEQMIVQISESIRKQVVDAGTHVVDGDASPERRAILDAFEKQSFQDIDDQLGWKAMEVPFTDIYVKTFTEEELDSIIAFYKSPAGMVVLEKMPTVNAELSRYGQSKLVALQPELKQLYADFQKNAAAPPPTLGPAPDKPAAPASHAAPTAPASPASPPK